MFSSPEQQLLQGIRIVTLILLLNILISVACLLLEL